LIAKSARACGLISSVSVVSTVDLTEEISTKPRTVIGGSNEGYTCLPFASTITASAGTASPTPTASIFPLRRITVPPGRSGPDTV
jgi:hypothetical protein